MSTFATSHVSARQSRQLHDFLSFLRFPSISTDPRHADDVRACAGWLANRLSAIGLSARVHPTPGHPIVVARNDHRPGRRHVLIYGHYDVQPVDPIDLWEHPPFEPRVLNGRVNARGATDNKGQILSHIFGVEETLAEQKDLPVNVTFLIEGEEEIGSIHLADFLRQHRDELRCDVVLVSDTGMVAPGLPTFTYGLRGVAGLELSLTGPSQDLHSGIFGGIVHNPLSALARLLATLHDDAGRVTIPGFYDDVPPAEPWELEAWKNVPLTMEDFLRLTGVPELAGEPGFSILERLWVRPTCELNGLWGGYQGEGSKTVIPSQAHAKITFRLVPGQDARHVLERARAYLTGLCPRTCKLTVDLGHSGEPYLVDPRTGFGGAATAALREAFPGTEPALIREGGSIPIIADFKAILGVDTLLLGLALPDAQIHAPNENFPLENLDLGRRINQAVLAAIAKA